LTKLPNITALRPKSWNQLNPFVRTYYGKIFTMYTYVNALYAMQNAGLYKKMKTRTAYPLSLDSVMGFRLRYRSRRGHGYERRGA
jgi:hypothetical protein